MATVGEQLVISYARAKAQNPSLRKGQFMQKVFQGRYKNEQSAYQAYNQTTRTTKPRSGKRLGVLSEKAQPPIRDPEIREKVRTGQIKRRPRPGGSSRGLWKVNVYLVYLDQDGKQQEETRSFIAESTQYNTLMDIPYIEEVVAASAEEYAEIWSDDYNIAYTVDHIEVVPIYRTDVNQEQKVIIDKPVQILAEDWPEPSGEWAE